MTVITLSSEEVTPAVNLTASVGSMFRVLGKIRNSAGRWLTRAAVKSGLLRYPSLAVSRPHTAEGLPIASYLKRRRHLPTLVLELPRSPGFYLRGRHRQAVRTNISKAAAMGLSVVASPPWHARSLAEAASNAGLDILHLPNYAAEAHGPGMIDWIGRDAEGSTIAFARVQVDGKLAMLKTMVAIRKDERSIIRYMLSGRLFEHLALQGVQHVIVQGSGDEPPGNRYFSARLGFEDQIVRIH